jgi:archaellin
MIPLVKLLSSPKFLIVVAVVVVSAFAGWFLIDYGKTQEKSRIVIEQQESYITTRKRIDNATKNLPNDADAARSRLLDRQANR